MTQNEKDILLKDLCARLPYGVKGLVTFNGNHFMTQIQVEDRIIDGKLYDRFAEFQGSWYDNVTIKPYLFPLSSMTEEQKNECFKGTPLELDKYGDIAAKCDFYGGCQYANLEMYLEVIVWLLKNHFDIYGLIPMGLGIDATGKNIY